MEIIKIIGISLIAIIIAVIIKQYKPEFAVYISIITGVIILLICTNYMANIISLVEILANKVNINTQFIKILIKITGIAILTEFAVSICKDSGETAIASKAEIGSKIIIISMSMPIIQALISTITKVLP